MAVGEKLKGTTQDTSLGISDVLRKNVPIFLSYFVVLMLFVVGIAKSTGFGSTANIRFLAEQATFIGVIGLGQTLCIITGGIDLSVPWTFTGAAVLTSILANGDASKLPVVLLEVLGLAILVGFLNGVGVAYAGVPPIIMTLGMSGCVEGLMLVYTHGGISSYPPTALGNWILDTTAGMPNLLWVWVVVLLLGIVILNFTTVGRALYAIGTNRDAARLAGINVRHMLVVPYVISAIGGAAGGVLLMGYTGQAYLTMGDPYLFASAAAVAVGGASILGGNGHYIGTVAGAFVLTLLNVLLILFNLGVGYLDIAYGIVLVTAAYIATQRFSKR